jgi:flagellar biosynthesis protein FlhG
MIINENQKRKIIPLASGKGGVGTTVLTANLALELAANEKNVVVVDLDLGGSNVHTALGLKNTNSGIGNFLTNPGLKLKDILVATPYENLRLIPGDVLVPGLSQVDQKRVQELYDALGRLKADYLLLDAGSGGGRDLDTFLLSNSGFVVMDNRKTSVLNTYGFFKNLVYRVLAGALHRKTKAQRLVNDAFWGKRPDSFNRLSAVLIELDDVDASAAREARKSLSLLKPKLIMNHAGDADDIETARKLAGLVERDFEIEIEIMGAVSHDPLMDQAMELGQPFMLVGGAESLAARQIARITQKIVQSEQFPDMPLDLEYYKDSFELAALEFENDLEEMEAAAQASQQDEGLTHEDLIGVIQEQQKKIQELKGTVRMLTMQQGEQ